MPEITGISKDVSMADDLVIYPYRDIGDDDWPVYVNKEGHKVPYDFGWREVGFKVPYPTVSRLRRISDLSQGLQVDKSKFKIVGGDPDKLANYIAFRLIKGTENLTDGGKEIEWNDKNKNWLYNQLCLSSFLLNNFRSTYELVAGEIKKSNEEEEENFTTSPESTSSESSSGMKSGSMEPNADTQETNSETE